MSKMAFIFFWIIIISFALIADEAYQVTSHPNWECNPRWSPCGTWIAFDTGRNGPADIYIYNINTEEERRITTDMDIDYAPRWHPDSEDVIFFSGRDGNADIWKKNINDYTITQLTDCPSHELMASYSPDGTRIAFQSDMYSQDDIFILNLETQELTRLTDNPAYDRAPEWSHDGQYIAFQSGRNGSDSIWRINVDTHELYQITDMEGTEIEANWHPTQHIIAFQNDPTMTGNSDIFICDLNGDNLQQITDEGGGSATWSPEGDAIAFHTDRHSADPGNYNVWAIDVDVESILNHNEILQNGITKIDNFPNPFNPVTGIQFELKASGNINCKIYNIKGELICNLIDSHHYPAGTHSITWDASGYASGVYMCRLSAKENIVIKKMVLMK